MSASGKDLVTWTLWSRFNYNANFNLPPTDVSSTTLANLASLRAIQSAPPKKLDILHGKQMQISNKGQHSELQKREQINAKLVTSNNGSANTLHNHLIPESATTISSGHTTNSNGTNMRFNNRLKSSVVGIEQSAGITSSATIYQINLSNNTNQIINNRLLNGRKQTAYATTAGTGLLLDSILAQNSHRVKRNNSNTNGNYYRSANSYPVTGAQSSSSTTAPTSTLFQLPASLVVINRTSEEQALCPDKLIMERKSLTHCPIIEGDEQLKLINYQHNMIRNIQNLDQMHALIFLDLYDNQIERIVGLNTLTNLRVLMLGKNRISKIENIGQLRLLDVLDLHGNQITNMENLNNLHELRVLNIAANQLKHVSDFSGLHSLIELNLRRNMIEDIDQIENCPKLQRLFLSHNELTSMSCIRDITALANLHELTVDNNPLGLDKYSKHVFLAQCNALKKFDGKRVTEEERRVAEKYFLKGETRKREIEQTMLVEKNRQLRIKEAEEKWASMQKEQVTDEEVAKEAKAFSDHSDTFSETHNANSNVVNAKSFDEFRTKDESASAQHKSTANSEIEAEFQSFSQLKRNKMIQLAKAQQAKTTQQPIKVTTMQDDSESCSSSSDSIHSEEPRASRITEPPLARSNTATVLARASSAIDSQPKKRVTVKSAYPSTTSTTTNNNKQRAVSYNDGSNLHENTTMFFYGPRSLDILDAKLEPSTVTQCINLSFHFVDFEEHISRTLGKIRNKFPNATSIAFTCCNISHLHQLDQLADLKHLDALTINDDDNPICSISVWRAYAIGRLVNLQLKRIDNQPVCVEDFRNANCLLNPIANLSLQLPEYKLIALLGQEKKNLITSAKENQQANADWQPSADHLVARDKVSKAVLASSSNAKLALKSSGSSTSDVSGGGESKLFLETIFAQMTSNDRKKKRVRELRDVLWTQLTDKCAQSVLDPDEHIADLCKDHKFSLL